MGSIPMGDLSLNDALLFPVPLELNRNCRDDQPDASWNPSRDHSA